MALPVTITGLNATVFPPAGPFRSSAGNFYFFGRDATTATTLQAYKSTAPDTSWSVIATRAGYITAILELASDQLGDVIHLLVTDGTSPGSVARKYLTFNMATDAFVTAETIYAAQNIQGGITSGYGADLVVRSTGEVVAFFNGLQVKVSGQQRAKLYYSRRTAPTVWSAAITVDAAGAFNYLRPVAVLGLSNAVHFLFTDTVNGKQRTLSAANALQTVSSIAAFPSQPPYAISYLTGGVQKIVAAEAVGSTSADAWRFDSGNTPAVTRVVVNNTTAQVPPVRVFNDGTDVYLVYRDNAADLQMVKSTDHGATWGAPTNIFTGSVANFDYALSVGNIYERGPNFVIPYLVLDGATLKYNEAIVRLVSNTGILTATETRDVAAIAGNAGISGVLTATETPDAAAITGFGVVSGTLVAAETPDTAALTGNTGPIGVIAATEAFDVAVLVGGVEITGTLVATEAPDVASISGPATITGTLTAFEFPDQARIDGRAEIQLALAATEAPDTAALAGNAGTSGVLVATEGFDAAAFSGAGVTLGQLLATETPDTAALTGGSGVSGVLVVSELPDTAALVGDFKIATGTLDATEARDVAAFTGTIVNNATGILDATERPDTAVIRVDFQRPPGQPLSNESDYDYDWYKRQPIRRHG